MGLSSAAQTAVLYHENFDTLPHNVVTYHTLTNSVPLWTTNSSLSVSPQNCYSANVLPYDTVFFKTFSFSTVGKPYVWLTFDHIAKVQYSQRGYISVSRDSGLTWHTLTSNEYRGNSQLFRTTNYFNEASYAGWGGYTSIGNGTQPTNAWWKNEVFDLTELAGKGPNGTANGYSHVMVRFSLQYRLFVPGASTAGWFVDNVRVQGSPCEPTPPVINWNYPLAKKPVGDRYTPTTTVQFRVIDKAGVSKKGVDTAYVHYRLNGGSWTTMSLAPSTSCPDSSEFIANISTPNAGDTVDYWVQGTDCGCVGNNVREPVAPGSYFTFWRVAAPPAMCGTSSVGSFPYVVSSLPFVENFEGSEWVPGTGTGISGVTHRGLFPIGNPPGGKNYEVSPASNVTGFAWSVRQGSVPSTTTGPSSDHTLGSGRYLYTEAAQGAVNALTSFTTPCIQLVNLNHAALEFYYHKFGSSMGLLRVDVDTGAGFAVGSGVIGAISLPGTTHSSQTDMWNSAVLNLQPYLNKYIRLRFVGTKASINSDMAIDDILLYEAPDFDINVLKVTEPVNGLCSYSAQSNVTLRLANRGWQQPTALPLAFSVKNVSTGVTVVQRDTMTVNWTAGGLANVTFNDKANLSAAGTYEVRAWVELASDLLRANDTAVMVQIVKPPTMVFPYFENFDSPAWLPGLGTPTSPGVFGSGDWVRNPEPVGTTGANTSIYVGKDLTPVEGTGPRWSRKNRGNYLYLGGPLGPATTAYLESTKCIDLSTATSPVLSFWYHSVGTGCGPIAVEYLPVGSNQWIPLSGSSLSMPFQTIETQDWQFHQVSLSLLVGQQVRLRISLSTNGTGVMYHTAIDELLIYNRPAADVGVTAITSPANTVSLTAPVGINVVVRNFGTAAQTNVPVTVVVSDRCTPSQSSTYTAVLPLLNPGTLATATIPAAGITYTPGDMLITAYTGLSNDVFHANDTAIRRTNGTIPLRIPFGPLTFDNCTADEYGFFVQGGSGTLQMWELGASQRGIPAFSGQNAWYLGLTQDGYGPYSEHLRFPPLVGLDTTYGASLRFKHRYDFVPGNGGRIEYLEGSTWLPLYDFVPFGSNWYNVNGVTPLPNLLVWPGWQGTTGGLYVTSSFPLTFWQDRTQPLVLRARYSEGLTAGTNVWAIDDIEVVAPPQNSVALIGARAESMLLEPGDSTRVLVWVQNDAERPVTSLTLKVHGLSSGATLQTLTLAGSGISKGQSRWVTLPSYFKVNSAGTLNPCVSVHRVNARLDGVANSDSLCFKVVCVAPVAVTSSSPFCTSFETADWPSESLNGGTDSWTRTTPNHGTVQTAYFGSKAYVTGAALYVEGARDALYSPRFTLDTALKYEVSFFHNMQSQAGIDGGLVQYSLDDVNWHQLGNTQSDGAVYWSTTQSVLSLDGRSGWSGSWPGYKTSSLRFAISQPSVRFRMVFGSDATVQNYGWALDQFCVTAAPAASPAVDLDGSADVVFTGCP